MGRERLLDDSNPAVQAVKNDPRWGIMMDIYRQTYATPSTNTLKQVEQLRVKNGIPPQASLTACGRAIYHVGVESLLAANCPPDLADDRIDQIVEGIRQEVDELVNQRLVDAGWVPDIGTLTKLIVEKQKRKTAAAFGQN